MPGAGAKLRFADSGAKQINSLNTFRKPSDEKEGDAYDVAF